MSQIQSSVSPVPDRRRVIPEQRSESIDWDAISDQNRIEDIGSTLYELASDLDKLGYEGTVAPSPA